MTHIPDPIELGEARAERHADRFFGTDQFQCFGCFGWFDFDVAVQSSPSPWAPPICPTCAGFPEGKSDE